MYTLYSVFNTFENIERSGDGAFAYAEDVSRNAAEIERVKRQARRDTEQVSGQVAGVRREVHEVKNQVDRGVRDAKQVWRQVDGAADKIGQMNRRVDVTVSETARVKRHLDNIDGDVKWLRQQIYEVGGELMTTKDRMTAMELRHQLLLDQMILMKANLPSQPINNYTIYKIYNGGNHMHVNDGANPGQYTRQFPTKLKSRPPRYKLGKMRSEGDSDYSDDEGYETPAK